MSSVAPRTENGQLDEVRNFHKLPPVDNFFYLIDEKWLKKWKKFQTKNYDRKYHPGPIDNEEIELKFKEKTLVEGFCAVNVHVWDYLKKFYKGGPELKISENEFQKISFAKNSRLRSDFLIERDGSDLSSVDFNVQNCNKYIVELKKPIGIKNYGVNCYMNAMLQFFKAVHCFDADFRFLVRTAKDEIYEELGKLFDPDHDGKGVVFDPKPLMISLCSKSKELKKLLSSKEESDTFEFYLLLLEILNEDLKKRPAEIPFKVVGDCKNPFWTKFLQENKNFITWLFYGFLENLFICGSCGHETKNFEIFCNFSLTFSGLSSLEKSLEEFFKIENLDTFNCEKCKKSTFASKKVKVGRMPKFLFVHLKKFDFEMRKINAKFDFPKTLKYFEKDFFEMELIGINLHLGSSITHGHYVSVVKHDSNWFVCDDDSVKDVTSTGQESVEDTVKSACLKDVYCLLYKARNN